MKKSTLKVGFQLYSHKFPLLKKPRLKVFNGIRVAWRFATDITDEWTNLPTNEMIKELE